MPTDYFSCDAVYRWVNQGAHGRVRDHKEDRARYRDNGELRFSIRSFAAVLGVRRFHIVGKGHAPEWLNTSHPRISWWNETQLLDELRVQRGINESLQVENSEASKLAIASLLNLAERFLLVDDDYFMVPGQEPLTTRLFFDHSGTALQPDPIENSHRPIPIMRDAYVQAVRLTSDKLVKKILRSGRTRIDLLPSWSRQMAKNGTALRFKNGHKISYPPYNRSISQGGPRFNSALYWLWNRSPKGISFAQAQEFFGTVIGKRPPFVCVNDNWPASATEYNASIGPFRNFLSKLYSETPPWEIFPDPAANHVGARRAAKEAPTLSNNHGIAKGGSRLSHRTSSVADDWVCKGTGDVLKLAGVAGQMPPTLKPLLAGLDVESRTRLKQNKAGLTVEDLTRSVSHLDVVDTDNGISVGHPPPQVRNLKVAELNAERGKHWCELAVQIMQTPQLRAVDIWLLNEFDLGMARSGQLHTVRHFAYALGMNYAWATEFIELTNGNRAEQLATKGQENRYGLHGNAILSRWPLQDARVVRMPDMAPLFSSHGRETANGYEKRLGSRMTLLATTGPASGNDIIVGSTHAQTSWRKRSAHVSRAIEVLQAEVNAPNRVNKPLIIGGDTWPKSCSLLNMTDLVTRPSPSNVLSDGAVRLSSANFMDDYICGRGVQKAPGTKVQRFPCRGRPVKDRQNKSVKLSEFVLSDHVFVTATVSF